VSRRDNRANRCVDCMMHMSLCVCSLVPRIETRTRLVLVIHRAEIRKPTNTGHLATRALVNSEVHVRGHEGEPSPPVHAAEDGRQPVLLFPAPDAAILTPALVASFSGRPVTLIVPDGNWRQASKVRARVPGLRAIPCVTLPPGPPSLYRLRSEAHPNGLATVEAIARALEILEDDARVRTLLEHLFRAMVERTLWVRGDLGAAEVTGGIPEGVTKHDPRSGPGETRAATGRPPGSPEPASDRPNPTVQRLP
jgi:DTW domain-containing protein